jgi:hypothetical protein
MRRWSVVWLLLVLGLGACDARSTADAGLDGALLDALP